MGVVLAAGAAGMSAQVGGMAAREHKTAGPSSGTRLVGTRTRTPRVAGPAS